MKRRIEFSEEAYVASLERLAVFTGAAAEEARKVRMAFKDAGKESVVAPYCGGWTWKAEAEKLGTLHVAFLTRLKTLRKRGGDV